MIVDPEEHYTRLINHVSWSGEQIGLLLDDQLEKDLKTWGFDRHFTSCAVKAIARAKHIKVSFGTVPDIRTGC